MHHQPNTIRIRNTPNPAGRTSTNFFTTKIGTTKVTSLNPDDQVKIAFFVTPVSANTRMDIELRPSAGTAFPLSKTAPATIGRTNVSIDFLSYTVLF